MNKLKRYLLLALAVLLTVTGAYADSAKQVDFLLSGYTDPLTHKVLSGGEVWTYLDGTSTLAPVWTDKDKGGVSTNPVVLDSAGRAEIYGDNIYKFVIYDDAGGWIEEITGLEYATTIGSIDDINAGLLTKVTKIDTIADLRTHTGYTGESVQVLGYDTPGDGGGGDLRVLKAGGSYIDDGWSVITPGGVPGSSAWVFAELIMTPGSGENQTANFGANVALRPVASKINIPAGKYHLNAYLQDYELQGEGSATVLSPFDATNESGFALRLGRHIDPFGDWDFYKIADLAFDSTGVIGASCVLLNSDGATPELAGRWLFDNVMFQGGPGGQNIYGLKKESGNIGNRLGNCTFRRLDYGYHAKDSSGGIMHVGADRLEGCHFDSIEKAAVYLKDNTDGYGQTTFADCIFEVNPGFGIFVDGLGALANVSPLKLSQVWFEDNAFATSVTIDSVVYTPHDMRFKDAKAVIIEGSYIKDMEVLNSDVVARDCRIDASVGTYYVTKDDDATIQLWNPSGFLCSPVDEWSHTAPSAIGPYQTNGQQMALRMSHRAVRSAATSRTVKSVGYEKTVYPFTGSVEVSTTQVTGGGLLLDDCAQLVIPASASVFDNANSATIPGGGWVVFSVAIKIVAGVGNFEDASLWNAFGGDQAAMIRHGELDEWVTTVSLVDMRTHADIPGEALSFRTNAGGSSTVQIADYQIANFSTKQGATDFIHSGIFEYTP